MTQNLALKSADPFFFRSEQKASVPVDRVRGLGKAAVHRFRRPAC
ncbi:MAG: hypothetical protein ACJATP_003645 [Candidatus Azotimanducaceae bacterium]|jgi:hypothetical protein